MYYLFDYQTGELIYYSSDRDNFYNYYQNLFHSAFELRQYNTMNNLLCMFVGDNNVLFK